MKKTGEFLKQKRENLELSLSEVALATKISPKVLAAIESGDTSQLPAKTFLKGFVRSYAVYLKANVDEVMSLFQEEMGGPAADRSMVESHRNETSSPRKSVDDESSSGFRAMAIGAIVVLIGLIIGVRELIEKYQKEKVVVETPAILAPPLAIPEPSRNAETTGTPEAIVEESQDTVKPVPDEVSDVDSQETVPMPANRVMAPPAATPTVAPPVPAQKAVATPAPAQKTVATQAPAPAPAPAVPVAAAKPAPPPPAAAQAAPASPPASPTATPQASAANPVVAKPTSALKATKNEIILEALDKVDVKFTVYGESKKVSLAPNQVHTIRADEAVQLDLSDGGAVNIILNGRERGVPGDPGKPKQIKIP